MDLLAKWSSVNIVTWGPFGSLFDLSSCISGIRLALAVPAEVVGLPRLMQSTPPFAVVQMSNSKCGPHQSCFLYPVYWLFPFCSRHRHSEAVKFCNKCLSSPVFHHFTSCNFLESCCLYKNNIFWLLFMWTYNKCNWVFSISIFIELSVAPSETLKEFIFWFSILSSENCMISFKFIFLWFIHQIFLECSRIYLPSSILLQRIEDRKGRIRSSVAGFPA